MWGLLICTCLFCTCSSHLSRQVLAIVLFASHFVLSPETLMSYLCKRLFEEHDLLASVDKLMKSAKLHCVIMNLSSMKGENTQYFDGSIADDTKSCIVEFHECHLRASYDMYSHAYNYGKNMAAPVDKLSVIRWYLCLERVLKTHRHLVSLYFSKHAGTRKNQII